MLLAIALSTAHAQNVECYDVNWTHYDSLSGFFEIASSKTTVDCDLTEPGQHWTPVNETYGAPNNREIWIRGDFGDPEYSWSINGQHALVDGPTLHNGYLWRDVNAQDEPATIVSPVLPPPEDDTHVNLVNVDDDTCLVSHQGNATGLHDCGLDKGWMEDMQYELREQASGDFTLYAQAFGECLFAEPLTTSPGYLIHSQACVNGAGDDFAFVPSASDAYKIRHTATGLCIDNDHTPVQLADCSTPGTDFYVVRTRRAGLGNTPVTPSHPWQGYMP